MRLTTGSLIALRLLAFSEGGKERQAFHDNDLAHSLSREDEACVLHGN